LENVKGRGHVDLGRDKRIISKWILEKYVEKVQAGLDPKYKFGDEILDLIQEGMS
jgi:hypothetical protein